MRPSSTRIQPSACSVPAASIAATAHPSMSSAPLTRPAHGTLMTGLLPAAHGVRDNGGFRLDPARRTLAEAFAAAGFRTGGFVSAYVLDHKWGIGQGFERYFDDFELAKVKTSNMGEIQRRGDETLARATAWIDEVAPAGRFFAWIHLYDPHTPYAAPEPFASAYRQAQLLAQWGQHDKALDALDLAFRVRDSNLIQLGQDHLLDPLRDLPRFRAMKQRIGFD